MTSVHRAVGWFIGLIGLGLCLLTLWHLVLMLSTQSNRDVIEGLPCCGRYLKSLLWNLGLLVLFVLQHSGMLSDIWKRMLIRLGVNSLLHRPLYVVCSCGILHLIINHMAVLPGPQLWYFDADEYSTLWLAVFLLHCMLWLIICAGTIAAEPTEFIGLKQLYSSDTQPKDLAQPADYLLHSRHVGVVAFVVILWVHMVMSVERFLLAMFWTLYVLFGYRASPFAIYVIRTENKQM